MFTDFLKLFKFSKTEEDPKTTTFNIDRFLNDNWDKLDSWLKSFSQTVVKTVYSIQPDSKGNVDLPSATLNTRGLVQLSDSYEKTDSTTAASSRAVALVKKAALDISQTDISLAGLSYASTLHRAGKFVRFANAADCQSLKSGQWYSIGTIPFGYKPLTDVRASVITFDTAQQIQLHVTSDGDVLVYNYGSNISSLRTFLFDVCWITGDA